MFLKITLCSSFTRHPSNLAMTYSLKLSRICVASCPDFPLVSNLVNNVKPCPNLFFKYRVGPKHWNWPLTMMPNLPHNSSHSSIECEVKIMDCPFRWTARIIFHNFRREAGSTPEVGSSRKMMGGSATRAWATFNLRLLPPL